jgi:hypothetical protein
MHFVFPSQIARKYSVKNITQMHQHAVKKDRALRGLSSPRPFGFLRAQRLRVALIGRPFLRTCVRDAFLIDPLDFALAEERIFGALRALFTREAFFATRRSFGTADWLEAGSGRKGSGRDT